MLQEFNIIQQNLQFTMDKEQNNKIHFLYITIHETEITFPTTYTASQRRQTQQYTIHHATPYNTK